MEWYDTYLRKEAEVENVDTDNFNADKFKGCLTEASSKCIYVALLSQ